VDLVVVLLVLLYPAVKETLSVFLSELSVVSLLDANLTEVDVYRVWTSALKPTIVETYYEALTLRRMVQAASKCSVEPCDIEKITQIKQ